MSHVLILVGSVRRNGNTQALAQACAEGARAAGHQVEIVSVADYHVHPCIGCEGCFQHPENQCVQQDDMQKIYPKLLWADVVAAASPVYFYGVSAQLKAIIDRCHTPLRNQFHIQKLALLLVGGATLPTLFDAILCQYQMILDYFRLSDGGRVVSGVRAPGRSLDIRSCKRRMRWGKICEILDRQIKKRVPTGLFSVYTVTGSSSLRFLQPPGLPAVWPWLCHWPASA